MTETTITKSVILTASRETVWEYLTDKDKLAEWFHPAENDLTAGQPYALTEANESGEKEKIVWGEVLEFQPPEKLVYTFTIKPLGGAMTTVTWELQEAPDGMKLLLTHSGIEEAAGEAAMKLLLALDVGWAKHILKLRGEVVPVD